MLVFSIVKIQITKLARDLSEIDLRRIFEKYGTVTECVLVMDEAKGTSKGFAFVTMPDEVQGLKAISELNAKAINKVPVKVKRVG